MKDHFDKVYEKLDKLDQRLDSIDVTLAVQATQLKEHIKRSNQNEEMISVLADEIKPIQVHVGVVNTIGKIGMWAVGSSAVAGVIKGLYTFFKPH